MVSFSRDLIEEYKTEMAEAYVVFLCDADAQIQLQSLVRSMFSTVIAGQMTESRESSARQGVTPSCRSSLSVMLSNDGGNEVGASITPTLGQEKK